MSCFTAATFLVTAVEQTAAEKAQRGQREDSGSENSLLNARARPNEDK